MPVELTEVIQARFPQHVIGAHGYRGQPTLVIRREGLFEVARFLRDEADAACDVLMDLSGADYLAFGRSTTSAPTLATPSPLPSYMTPAPTAEAWERLVSDDEYRFEVVCHLYSSRHNHRLRLKVPLRSADPVVESVTGLWASANWFEREVWDMFGITFTGHPNLKRLLLYASFEGHPLRKDYPVNKRQPLIGPLN